MTEAIPYNPVFEECVLTTVADLESKLERKLASDERDALFSAGSLMMLETLGMAVYYFKSKEKLELELEQFCTMAKGRFAQAMETAAPDVSKHLGRHLTPDEAALLEGAKSIHEINLLAERFKEEAGD